MLGRAEIELIAALVEGRLEDESEARALLARSEDARVEYRAQRIAFDALRAEPRPELTEDERSALHRDVWTALRSDPEPSPRRAPWFLRLGYAAAGLLVIVGLAAVLTQIDGDGAGDFVETQEALEDASDEGGALAPSEEEAPATREAEGDAVAEAEDEFRVTAMAATMAPAEFFEDVARQVREADLDPSRVTTLDEEDTETALACLAEAGLEGHDPVAEAIYSDEEVSESYLVAVPDGSDIGEDTTVSFVLEPQCELAHVED